MLVKENEFDFIDDYEDGVVTDSGQYYFIKSKSVMDSDGFYTDYTMYYDRYNE